MIIPLPERIFRCRILIQVTMCGTVVINLVPGTPDQKKKPEAGNRVDRCCRWVFPLSCLDLLPIVIGAAFPFF